jgi:hypothetical protein
VVIVIVKAIIIKSATTGYCKIKKKLQPSAKKPATLKFDKSETIEICS